MPALWRLRQNGLEFQASPGYSMRSHLNKNKTENKTKAHCDSPGQLFARQFIIYMVGIKATRHLQNVCRYKKLLAFNLCKILRHSSATIHYVITYTFIYTRAEKSKQIFMASARQKAVKRKQADSTRAGYKIRDTRSPTPCLGNLFTIFQRNALGKHQAVPFFSTSRDILIVQAARQKCSHTSTTIYSASFAKQLVFICEHLKPKLCDDGFWLSGGPK